MFRSSGAVIPGICLPGFGCRFCAIAPDFLATNRLVKTAKIHMWIGASPFLLAFSMAFFNS